MKHKNSNGANLGFENKLWEMADKLRGHVDASEYKHVVLGLIFLKYISDAFQAKYKQLEAAKETEYTDPEDRDEYAAANIFWVPKVARWDKLQARAKFRFKKNNNLFGKLHPYFHKVGVPAIDGVCSTDIVVATPSQSHWFGLLLGHLSSDEFIAYTNAASTGTKMPRTNWKDMSRYRVTIPPTSIAEVFNYHSRAFIDQIHANIFESHTLASIRGTLLPKLLSGELRIPDAEKFVEGTSV